MDWQCCLADSSKMAPRILIFSIAMDANNSFYVKFIATYAPTYFGCIISVLAMVIRYVTMKENMSCTICKSNSKYEINTQKRKKTDEEKVLL